jgi:single-strand DNA-binding protein
MTDLITVTGVVGSDPRHTVTGQGLAITSFRLASTRRYFDRAKGSWEDGETNWFTVATFRNLAVNAARSLRKGERVVVRGRLRLRAWDTGEKSGLAVEIEADAVGHDLGWGVSSWQKAGPARSADDLAPASSATGGNWPMGDDTSAAAPQAGGFDPIDAPEPSESELDGVAEQHDRVDGFGLAEPGASVEAVDSDEPAAALAG